VKRPVAALVILLAAGNDVAAHRLDEYLQATRVSFARDQLALDVDLTPGASIAPGIIAMLDTNSDGSIASAEAEAYGRIVVSDLRVTLDGKAVVLTLDRAEIPPIDDMRHGTGVIRLHAKGGIEAGTGRHALQIVNNHRPETSVYMVNALVPEDSGIDIVSQTRDARQREFSAEYEVTSEWVGYVTFLGMGAAGVVLATKRRNEKRKANSEKHKGRTV
jgi:hypothetical protein